MVQIKRKLSGTKSARSKATDCTDTRSCDYSPVVCISFSNIRCDKVQEPTDSSDVCTSTCSFVDIRKSVKDNAAECTEICVAVVKLYAVVSFPEPPMKKEIMELMKCFEVDLCFSKELPSCELEDDFKKKRHEANASPEKIQVHVRKCSKSESCCESAEMTIRIPHIDENEDFIRAVLIFEGDSGEKSNKHLLGGIEITRDYKLKFHSLNGKTSSWSSKVIKRCGVTGKIFAFETETYEPETGEVRRRYIVFQCDISHTLCELLTGFFQLYLDPDSTNEDLLYVMEYYDRE